MACLLVALILCLAAPVLAEEKPPSPAGGSNTPAAGRRTAVPEEDPNFVALMDRLGERAALYRKKALGFTCREVVISGKYDLDNGSYKKGDRSNYDYLFEERSDGSLREVREEVVKDGDGVKRRGTDFEPESPPAYAWATLFSKENRARFHFRPAGQVVKAYRLLTMIQFIGTSPNPGGSEISGWSGTVAVEGKTLNLWSIQAEPSGQDVRLEVEVLKYRRAFAIAGVPLASRPHGWKLDVTFGIEVEGLSYPTEQSLAKTALAPSQQMVVEEKQTFKYDNYRFFGVSTEEDVKEEAPPD
ncbi:MAG: hypothetical protein ACREAA_01030 [Candidatus Polarisedimenticolia bacterium]